jgi:hypothetical protein
LKAEVGDFTGVMFKKDRDFIQLDNA